MARASARDAARRPRRDRQEHDRLRVRRRDRRHRLRADVPRGGDVRRRLRRARRRLPAGSPRQRQGVPDHACPRGPHRWPALRAAVLPRRADLRLDARPRPARLQDQGAQADQQPAAQLRAGADCAAGRVRGDAFPNRPLDPRRDGHQPEHAGRAGSSTPATSSSTTRRSTARCRICTPLPSSAKRACCAS